MMKILAFLAIIPFAVVGLMFLISFLIAILS